MAIDDDRRRRDDILREHIPRCEELVAHYKVGIEHQYQKMINLNHELGRLNERIGDSDDYI
ncbi:hypothetical protein MTQ13_07240 [Streptomyces sp. XM4011]|uniref:hypothetical protein n=1 Tax=Streptomyces TaxID=1883 RepID=UPI000A65B440|nr:hypothetical protein [Streptomyces sp. XM4011]MCK1814070.1 hypothetical protein [Streptomyces sp. XM4011]